MKTLVFLLLLHFVSAQRQTSQTTTTTDTSSNREITQPFRSQLQSFPSTNTFDLISNQRAVTNGFDLTPGLLNDGQLGLDLNSGFNQLGQYPYNQNFYSQGTYSQYPFNQLANNPYPYNQFPYNQYPLSTFMTQQPMFGNAMNFNPLGSGLGYNQLMKTSNPYNSFGNGLGYNQMMKSNMPYNAIYSNQMGMDPFYMQQLLLNRQQMYLAQQPLMGAGSNLYGGSLAKNSGKRQRLNRP